MMQSFDAVAFIEEGQERPLDPRSTPFLYNDHGLARFYSNPRGRCISLVEKDPHQLLGTRYDNVSSHAKKIATHTGSYAITELVFGSQPEEVVYQPLWATAETARAFGMTLLQSGESIGFEYQNLVLGQFTYGKWAGHQSPYLGPARQRELLTYNPTDLEFHDFAHVFLARHGRLPLVISVARWLPDRGQIHMADLWLKPGDALVLPPQRMPEKSASQSAGPPRVVDLHGNRNSALACWFTDGEHSLQTETILADRPTMSSEAHGPHYQQQQTPTRHSPPQGWPSLDGEGFGSGQ